MGLEKIILAPDAGAINNPGISDANRKTIQLCQEWGYEVQVAWWGQAEKTKYLDIDELLVAGRGTEVQLISPEEFFKLHSLATREKLEAKTVCRKGLSQTALPVHNPHPEGKKNPDLTYCPGERHSHWTKLEHPILMDSSGVGSGKSYDAGLLEPGDFGASQIRYLTSDPRNPSVATLADWPLYQGRHQGIKAVQLSGSEGTTETQFRRAKPGDKDLVAKPNCDRTALSDLFAERNVPPSADLVCKGCPWLKGCASGLGKFDFIHKRIAVSQQPRARAHPSSIMPEGIQPNTVFILEEASTLEWFKSYTVQLADIDHELVNLSEQQETSKLAALIAAVRKLRQLLLDEPPRYGLAHAQLVESIEPIPAFSEAELTELCPLDLSFLETEGATAEDEKLLKSVKNSYVEESAALTISLRWLPDFIAALQGQSVRLRLNKTGLIITQKNQKLLEILSHPHVKKVILLDATEAPEFFQQLLGQPVYHIQQETVKAEETAELNVVQVRGLGLVSLERGERQHKAVQAVLKVLQTKHPNIGVITAKKFADAGNGYWYRDSRGRNQYAKCQHLLLIGPPIPNLGAITDQYALLTQTSPTSESVLRTYPIHATNHPSDGPRWVRTLEEAQDPKLAQFIRRRILSEIDQAIGRLRANRRPGEKLTIYFLSDYPLDRPVTLVSAGELSAAAQSRTGVTTAKIQDAIATLKRRGKKVTQQAIAKQAGISQGEVSKSLSERDVGWFDIIPNTIDIYSVRNYSEPHANPDAQEIPAIETHQTSFPDNLYPPTPAGETSSTCTDPSVLVSPIPQPRLEVVPEERSELSRYSFRIGDIVQVSRHGGALFRIARIIDGQAWLHWLNQFVPLVAIPVSLEELKLVQDPIGQVA